MMSMHADDSPDEQVDLAALAARGQLQRLFERRAACVLGREKKEKRARVKRGSEGRWEGGEGGA